MKKQTTIWKSYGMYTCVQLEEAKEDTKEFLKESYPDIELTDENIERENSKKVLTCLSRTS